MNRSKTVRRPIVVSLCVSLLCLTWTGPTLGLDGQPVPEEVVKSSEFNLQAGTEYQPDGPITTFRYSNDQFWLMSLWNKTRGGIEHVKSRGPLARPLRQIQWVKPQSQLFTYDRKRFDGNFWIVNLYQHPAGLLAFVHVENALGSGHDKVTGKHVGPGKTRIGIAWSVDEGNTFTFLGHIIIPFRDPDPHNVQGAPYLIRDGIIYLYYHDTNGLSVAQAPLNDVIAAAKRGQTSPWLKYHGLENGFAQPGLAGASTKLGIDGITHSDAACSSFSGKCYLVLTRMTWHRKDSWVRLFASRDGIQWVPVRTIALTPPRDQVGGYQYCSMVDTQGTDNGLVGMHFYLFCNKDHTQATRLIQRWKIELSN